jgi:hypothetical protein
MTERTEVSDADKAGLRHLDGTPVTKDELRALVFLADYADDGSWDVDFQRPILVEQFAEVRAEGYAAGVAAEREATGSRAAYAGFGAWAFEQFWHDAEPGDIDAGDAQEAAIKYGLLRRRVEGDEGATCGTEIGCDYSHGDPVSKCECLFPVFAPLRARAGAPSPQESGTGASGGGNG